MEPSRRCSAVLLLGCAGVLAARPAAGAALDLSVEYRLRSLSYRNLELDPALKSSDAFLSERARLGFLVKKISLETVSGEESSMEVGLAMQALAVSGSTAPLTGAVARAAARYPRSDMTPFVENAYLRVFNPMGTRAELTVGRQPAQQGSGLVLADDGLGFTGISLKKRPAEAWGGQAFYFQPRAVGTSAARKLHVAGAALDIPMDGTLSLSEVMESDRSGAVEAGIPLRSAVRHFLGARYHLRTEQFAFEGEAALQRGSAEPAAGGNKIPYRGAATSLAGLWRQDLGRLGQGSARLAVAEGTGDDPSSPGRNEGFFPSFGHRFDGLERDGWGELFGASLYDAIGPSSATANGLPAGVSGIRAVRLGITPPLVRGVRVDLDYLLFSASEAPASKDLGKETDIRLSYTVKDRLSLKLSAAFFTAGKALSAKSTSASRFALEIAGKF